MTTNYGEAQWGRYGGDLTIFVGNEPHTPESGIVVTQATLRDALQAIVCGYEVARRAVTSEDEDSDTPYTMNPQQAQGGSEKG